MDLKAVWFVLISVLFTGFFFLEGFDFGVGVLLKFIGRKDSERRAVINTIGPFWDGNEVWLITAGGAIFAAFPHWYATMFSGYYLALLIILVALILRGVAFEFRSKRESEDWRKSWDNIIFGSSLVLPVLWGIALSNLIKGVPIDSSMNYVGGFFDLISIFTLTAGLTTLLVFVFHGAIFLSLKSQDEIENRAAYSARKIGLYAIIASCLLSLLAFLQTDLYQSKLAVTCVSLSILLLIISWQLVKKGRLKAAMLINGFSIASGVGALFSGLFPRVMISSINSQYSLTIYNASSSAVTLALMTKVALVFIPIVLAYQGWTYWVFRKRVDTKDIEY